MSIHEKEMEFLDWQNKIAAYLQIFCSEQHNAQTVKTIAENFPYKIHHCTIYNTLRRLTTKFSTEFKRGDTRDINGYVYWSETEWDEEETELDEEETELDEEEKENEE